MAGNGIKKGGRVPPNEYLANFIYDSYIVPAQARGERQVTVPVLQVWKALDCMYTPDFIRGILGSMKFRNTYHLSLTSTEEASLPAAYTFKLHRYDSASPAA